MQSIYDFVKQQRDNYRTQTIEITPGYEFNQYETLRTIELYHNSRFTTGNKDSLGREKPFYNICKFRVNVATRATDIDTKDVQIDSVRTTEKSATAAFILNLKNRNWMRESGFAPFLNNFGHTRCKYGGVMVKKSEQSAELRLDVVSWRDLITDQIDIESGVKIERHYYTPASLKTDAPSNWKNIDDAIETAKKSQEAQAGNSPSKANLTPGASIEVFEIHGVLPTCYLAGTSDKYPETYGAETEYERQMHVVVIDESDKDNTTGITLYAGIESEDPYKYLPYEKVPGRGLGVGVIEDLFEAQVWTNYSVKQKKDMLDLAGKIIWQTADSSVAAKNVLTDIESGTILTTAVNMPITQVNNVPASLPGFNEVINEWNQQAEHVTSTYPAILGQTPPRGTAYRLMAAMNQEAAALFEYRHEEASIFIQEIYFDWVLPFLAKQIKDDKELTATLEPEELEMVADALAAHEAATFGKEQILSGKDVTAQDIAGIKDAAGNWHMKTSRRGFNKFADLFTDWEGTVTVDISGEQHDKKAVLESIFNIFKLIMQAPQILQDPQMARLFNEALELSGISPVLVPKAQQQAPQAQAQPQPQQHTIAPQPQIPQTPVANVPIAKAA